MTINKHLIKNLPPLNGHPGIFCQIYIEGVYFDKASPNNVGYT